MKYQTLITAGCLAAFSTQAEIIPIDISPEGTSTAVGLSPLNEIQDPAVESDGSGDEIFTGLSYDTDTMTLAVSIGYGSYAGFTDLTGPAIDAHIHGPAGVDENAAPIFDFAAQHLFAPDPSQGGVIIGGAVLDEAQAVDLLNGLYYVNIHTEANPAGEIRGQLIPLVNHAPEILCPDPVEAECEPPDGTIVKLVASVFDEDGDALVVVWRINGEVVHSEEIPAGDEVTKADSVFAGQYGVGVHEVEVTVTDGSQEPIPCTTTVTIVDTMAPEIIRTVTNPKVLWPPNHKMVPVAVRVRALDCSGYHSEIVGVRSNEPINGKGDGNTSPDWEVTGRLKLLLRAERAGGGSGRVYTITVKTYDAFGNSTMSDVKVRVPHDMREFHYDREHEDDRKIEHRGPDPRGGRGQYDR